MALALALTTAAVVVFAGLRFGLGPRPGMEAREFEQASPAGSRRPPALTRIVPVPLSPDAVSTTSASISLIAFRGRLRIERPGSYCLRLRCSGSASMVVDGRKVLEVNPRRAARPGSGVTTNWRSYEARIDDPGLHPIEVDYRPPGRGVEPYLEVAATGRELLPGPPPEASIYLPDTKAWQFTARGWGDVGLAAAIVVWLWLAVRIALSPARFRALVFKTAAVVLSTLVFCAAAEVALRIAGVTPRTYLPSDIWTWYGPFEPGRTIRYVGWLPYNVKEFEVPVTLNSRGWRDREHALAKPPGVYRIVVVGDSYVEGKEVPLEATFHKRLEARLNAFAGRDRFEVIAISAGGRGAVDVLRFLQTEGMRYDPDLVIFSFFAGNDVREDSAPLRRRFHQWSVNVYDDEIVPAKARCIRRGLLIRGSYLNHFIVDRVCEAYAANLFRFDRDVTAADLVSVDAQVFRAGEYDPEWKEAWRTTLEAIARARDVARAHGARFVLLSVCSTPELEFGAARRNDAEWDFLKPSRIIARFCAAEGIDLVDTGPALRRFRERTGESFCWRYDAHWNDNGHRVTADLLFDHLLPRLERGQALDPESYEGTGEAGRPRENSPASTGAPNR